MAGVTIALPRDHQLLDECEPVYLPITKEGGEPSMERVPRLCAIPKLMLSSREATNCPDKGVLVGRPAGKNRIGLRLILK
jgi:hypothetical protein